MMVGGMGEGGRRLVVLTAQMSRKEQEAGG